MEIFDEKFKSNKISYVLQCLLASSTVFIILLVLDAKNNAVVISALGASSFIAFTMPERVSSRPRYLIGGYMEGIISGGVIHALLPFISGIFSSGILNYAFFGALAVGLSIFLMVVIQTEHPPAAGLALALIINVSGPSSP
ncbi:MAG TPA: HPP family protein [Nitrospiria bacterium]|jgi:CBS-domain-containing membrane protein